jgi:hypothetical protein
MEIQLGAAADEYKRGCKTQKRPACSSEVGHPAASRQRLSMKLNATNLALPIS